MNAVAADARPLPRLLIEDDAVAAGLMSDELQAADDLPVEHVSTLADGVRAAARGVAVVVLDLGLPDSAGTETFYAFSARHPDLPVVVVSGHPREPIGHELIRAGAEEFVEKSALGVGVLPMAVNAASLRWQRRNQYADAIVGSGVSRLRPVSMAAATTALGMIPLLLDAFFVAMAVTIIFGLIFATILTMLVLPVFYCVVYRVPSEAPGPSMIRE